ncbi:MAG TPA: hypothetical protein VMP01_15630 [Pirellulaceae bacterium]|nr:hypothetical protein [Pirellulaceae bacterium]
MRTMLPWAAIAIVLASATFAQAGGGCAVAAPACGVHDNACGAGCGRGGCGLFGRHGGGSGIGGLDRHFNCGCRGSYNYPVPPQYTYHWPGMYKQNLMTDYTSPWRFPPLKAYVDEVPAQPAAGMPLPNFRTVSAVEVIPSATSRAGEIESISSRLSRGR